MGQLLRVLIEMIEMIINLLEDSLLEEGEEEDLEEEEEEDLEEEE